MVEALGEMAETSGAHSVYEINSEVVVKLLTKMMKYGFAQDDALSVIQLKYILFGRKFWIIT